MHHVPDDITVIEQVLQGRQSAYAILVTRYQAYVFTLVMRYINNRELAEELSQDVFVKAYRCLADFKRKSKFSTWLYTIVHTTCLSHLRKKKDETVLLEHDRIVAVSDHYNANEQPGEWLEQKTQQQTMANAINQLPADDAQILMLFYQAEQSVEEIGVIMGITTSNVKVKLYRARQKLRDKLIPANVAAGKREEHVF